ncbi:MAG TPA: tetratricopeptide repeat protein [Thermoanaerobaculia bacterium]|nr:tetratricopeptide repeat protein [Thermoanaerobaculia bacterium]
MRLVGIISALLMATALTWAETVAVRTPDLSGLESAVAAQIGEMQGLLTAQTASSAADPLGVARAYGDLGQVYLAYGFNDAAADCFRNAADLDGKEARWPYLLGATLQSSGKLDDAAAAFARALELAPAAAAGYVHLGEIRLLQGRPEEAEAVLAKALATPAVVAAAHSLLGQAALARREFSAAARHLEAALAAVPAANRLHYPLALAYRGLGDRAKTEEHLKQAGQVGLKPPDPWLEAVTDLRVGERIALMRGRVAARAGRYADAEQEFRKALAAQPKSVEARVNLGSMLALREDRAGAVAQFRDALRLDPANATAHFNLAALLADGPERGEALEHAAAAVAAWPGDAEARRLYAQLLRDGGRLAEALPEYARAVELAPGDETARLGEAETLVRLARYAEARRKLEAGLSQMPASGLLSHALARLLAACPDRSVRDGNRALELAMAVWNAQPAAPHGETVALALAELDRCTEAAEWQRKAIDAARQEGLESRLGELARALSVYEKGSPCRP